MKKIIALLFTLSFCLSFMQTFAALRENEEEFIGNGDFEALNSSGYFLGWGSLKAGYIGKTDPKGGKYCLELICTEETGAAIYATNTLLNIDDKNTYVLTFDYKSSDGGNPHFKFVFRDEKAESLKEVTVSNEFGGGTKDKWTTYTYTIKPEPGTYRIDLYVRGRNAGTSSWYDNISVTGIPRPDAPYEKKAPYEGAKDMVLNPSFEDGTENYSPYQNNWGSVVSIDESVAHTGSKSLKIATDEGGFPWARQEITGLSGNTEYQLYFWYMGKNIGGSGIAVKLEFYDEAGKNFAEVLSPYVGNTKGKWKESGLLFKTPKGTTSVKAYFRLYGTGIANFDDISLYRTSAVPRLSMDTDWNFFYPDMETGTAFIYPNITDYPTLLEGSARVQIFDGDKLLENSGPLPITENAVKYVFSTKEFTEIGKPYIVRCSVTDKNGTTKTTEKAVYRYKRPDILNSDGTLQLDGKKTVAMMGYHIYDEKMMKEAAEAGINVVQGMGNTPEAVDAFLTSCQKFGMRAIVVLYRNMLPAGEESNAERTKEIVNRVKNHPGLLGWLIADEPYLYMADPYDALINSYRIIRDADPVHPIFIQCDDSGRKWRDCAEACDTLIIHNYPITKNSVGKADIIADVRKTVDNARNAVAKDGFPIWFLGQSFGNDRAAAGSAGSSQYVLPNIAEYRKILYIAAFDGIQGLGTYSFAETGWNITDAYSAPLLEGMKTFANKEFPYLENAFIKNEYSFLNEGKDESAWWRTYYDGKHVYLFAINAKAADRAEATIPLKSANGLTGVSSYSGSLIAGDGQASVSGTGSITLAIKADDVLVYKLTPANSLDMEAAKVVFTDLENHGWAKEDILSLYEKGIVNKRGASTYEPDLPITRGEFAMFLVRTLGLLSSVTDRSDNFDDVDRTAEYAKYVAIGKEHGILKGVGDNKYNPEAEISRQDLMTIISRGMALTKEGDISAFTDTGLIADYALPHVKAMIGEDLIAGNADGTINPLGNTTRAEAAVIMSRILKMR